VSADPFDDLNNLRFKPEAAAAIRANADKQAQAQPKRRRSREPFTKFPHSWESRLLKTRRVSTYRVALRLLYLHWKAAGRPILLANAALAEKGVSRYSKWKAMAELARLGLIKVERRNRKSPSVRILVE
jgi:hypothetical protein